MNALFRPLLKYWYLVLGMTVLVSALAGWQDDPVYESRARLLYKLGDEFLQTGAGPDARTSGRILLAEAMNTDVQILTSHDQYAKVVDELGADTFRAPSDRADDPGEGDELGREDAIGMLRRGLNVKSVENSAVIHLSYEHADPARAKLVLATLIDVYFRERAELLGTRESSPLAPIRDEAFERYSALREAYERFLAGTSLEDMESTLGILRQQLMGLAADARNTRRELSGNARQLAAIETEIDRQPASRRVYSEAGSSAALDGVRDRLVELRLEEQQALGKYTETSRTVRDLRSEIAELQAIIASEQDAGAQSAFRTANNPIRDSLEMQRAELTVSTAGAEARLEALTAQESALQAELRDLEQRLSAAAKLDDELAVAESRFRDIDQRLLADRIRADSEAAREASVRIIEAPALPRGAAGLAPTARYGLGALIGFLAGWLLAFWIGLLGTRRDRAGDGPDRAPQGRVYALGSDQPVGFAHAGAHAGIAPVPPRHAPDGMPPVLGEFGTPAGASR